MQLIRNHKRKFEDLDDNEIYYIYQKPKKVTTSSHYSPKTQPARLTSHLFHLKPGSANFKLFDMCLEFVAANAECVDSFTTLPSLIGEQIFNECLRLGKFNSKFYQSNTIYQCLCAFANAYPDLFIESLDLSGHHEKNNLLYHFSIISKCSVKKLNLSDTNLNELSTEFKSDQLNLSEVLKNSQKTLEHLNLSGNSLTEDFIQKLTISQRLQSMDFSQLTSIDLTKNYKLKSMDFLRYFTKYSNLNEIRFSVQKDETAFISLTNLNRRDPSLFFGFRICKCPQKFQEFKNIGWFNKQCVEELNCNNTHLQVDSKSEYRMIQNNENVKTNLRFYDKQSEISRLKTLKETSQRMDSLFKSITLKRACTCFKYKTSSDLSFHQQVKKPTSGEIKTGKSLANVLIDNDLLRMYS